MGCFKKICNRNVSPKVTYRTKMHIFVICPEYDLQFSKYDIGSLKMRVGTFHISHAMYLLLNRKKTIIKIKCNKRTSSNGMQQYNFNTLTSVTFCIFLTPSEISICLLQSNI
jgi:hypothetical protein